MDKLQGIIHSLGKEDQQEFGRFIRRKKQQKARKDLALFRLLAQTQTWKPETLIKRLYDQPNPIAYHALRKRLMRHLCDFIVLKRMEHHETAQYGFSGLLAMANHLFDHNLPSQGWELLLKAEKLALKQEAFEQLNSIYLLQISHASDQAPFQLSEILEKHQTNKQLAEEEERTIIALSLVRRELQLAKNQGHVPDFAYIIRNIQAQYHLTSVVNKRPSLFYRFMSIARAVVLVNKDFHAFAPFLAEQYQEMVNQNAFKPHHLTYQLELLYMLAHVWYRCKQFTRSRQLIKATTALIHQGGKGIRDRFLAKFILIDAANLNYLGKYRDSILCLEDLLKKPLTVQESLDAKFSLSFCYLLTQHPKKALSLNLGIKHSDNWLLKKMGREWVIKKSVGEIMLQYDLGNEEIALNMLKKVKKKFADAMQLAHYANVKAYLKLVETMINHPALVTSEAFYDQIKANIHYLPFEEEDLQYVSFYAWLKAKVVKQPYNQVLQELLELGK